jgi:hypothetical protein
MSEEIFKENLPIQFHFSPYYRGESKTNTVEKADATGKKRMYIEGVASGPKVDGHEERMTEKAIKSFMNQANAGTLLLYPDIHGIRSSQDIGILQKADILPDGNWFTSFRLYDDMDDVDQASRDIAKKLFKQCAGLPPYPKPLQKGFSVEGFIPPYGLLSAEKDEHGNVKKRVIDDVFLDGVILCPRPAYQDSIAHSVYKALGEMNPYKRDKITKTIQSALRECIQEKEISQQYYSKRWDISSALDKEIETIMRKPDPDKKQQLEILFDEFKELNIELLMASESLFIKTDEDAIDTGAVYGVDIAKSNAASKLEEYRRIYKSLLDFKKSHNL